MKFEDLAYSLFGNNLVIGTHIRKQLAFLNEIVPEGLLHREMDDLGCGDGKVTLLLGEILRPARLRGFDVNLGLVKRARGRGIDAGLIDLDRAVPGGELAVLWGVMHHLRDFEACLRRVKESYSLVLIREPVRTHLMTGLELGHPLRMKDILNLVNRHMPGSQIHFCDHSIMVFYASPEYAGQLDSSRLPARSAGSYEMAAAARR